MVFLPHPLPPLWGGVGSVVFLVLVGAAAPVRCDGLAWILDLSASWSPISPPSSRAVRGLSVASKLEQRDSPRPEIIQRERERERRYTYIQLYINYHNNSAELLLIIETLGLGLYGQVHNQCPLRCRQK